MSTYTMLAQLGDWTFWGWDGHPFEAHQGRTLYAYSPNRKLEDGSDDPNNLDHNGKPKTGEWFASLDRALIGAVGEKYTGPRGAGGTGVGTAADWFARMIGMDALVAVDYQAGQKAIQEILVETAKHDGPIYQRARAITTQMEARGLTLAAQVHP